MPKPLRTPLERIERAGRNIMAAVLGLLLAASVGGLVFPSHPIQDGTPRFRPPTKPDMAERLLVPELQIDAPVIPIALTAGDALNPPDDPNVLGWWNQSALPGAPVGQTLITGHTVHNGGGQMDHLGSISPGAHIQVVTASGTIWYAESGLLILSKDEVTKRAEEIFNQTRKPGRLVLITCTGWTGHDYTGNVVVFADQLGVPIPTASPSPSAKSSPTHH